MELQQVQTQQLGQLQLQNAALLQMSAQELEEYIRELALENPLVELPDAPYIPEQGRDDRLQRLRRLRESGRQNAPSGAAGAGGLDPDLLAGTDGGLSETLFSFVSRQIAALAPEEEVARAACYLAACLEDDGYLREALPRLSRDGRFPLPLLEQALRLLRTLEPAGIGARDLSDCLLLQLERLGEDGTAAKIVRGRLELLAAGEYGKLARALGVSTGEVLSAQALIRSLDPRPGAAFQTAGPTPYILPDLILEPGGGGFLVRPAREEREPFRIDRQYLELLSRTENGEVRRYLREKLCQAENVLFGVRQRQETLLRCAREIAGRQSRFFASGSREDLRPLRMTEVAQQLGVHVSTVSRAVRLKYLQCPSGLFPLRYFFSQGAAGGGETLSVTAVQALLRRLIGEEDPARPLSDRALQERLAGEGCRLSRRAVSKHRQAMDIPPACRRRYTGHTGR